MKNTNKYSIVYCAIIVIFLFSGCGILKTNTNVNQSEKNDTQTQIYIPIISKGWQHQFWQAVKMGADKAAKDYNVKITFEGPEGDNAISKQIEMIDSALSKNPGALILAACDSKSVIPELEKAKAANIPVIGFDSGVDSDIPVTTVTTDNLSAAGAAADKMAVAIGQEGEVAILSHDSDNVSATGTLRRDGFVNRIKEKYPNVKIVDIQYGGGDHAMSKDLTKKIIENHPNIKGIFATNEGAAVGLVNGVIEENKVGKIVLVGFDAGKLQKDAVKSEIMLGAISQDPVMIGYKAVEAACKVLQGEKVENTIDTGYKWYDKTNIDSEGLKPLLYD